MDSRNLEANTPDELAAQKDAAIDAVCARTGEEAGLYWTQADELDENGDPKAIT